MEAASSSMLHLLTLSFAHSLKQYMSYGQYLWLKRHGSYRRAFVGSLILSNCRICLNHCSQNCGKLRRDARCNLNHNMGTHVVLTYWPLPTWFQVHGLFNGKHKPFRRLWATILPTSWCAGTKSVPRSAPSSFPGSIHVPETLVSIA